MKVAVIGSGNIGCALSFKLAENRHDVRLIKTSHSLHDANFEKIKETGGISCIDDTMNKTSFLPLSLITRNIAEGIQDADVILILTQSLYHRQIAEKICPILQNGQIVFTIPGNMGSALLAAHTKGKDITYVDGESSPYDARIVEPGTVRILFKNVRNAVAFLDKDKEGKLPVIEELFRSHKYLRSNIVETALHNPNMIIHTVGIIMSASRIEYSDGEFWMYKEAFTPSIWNIIEKLDEEKNKVIVAYGGKELSYLDACKWRNEEDLMKNSLDVFKEYAATGGPKGPENLNTRYVHEDVPMGLCLLENLASIKSISTPITSALITIASSLMKIDYRAQAYSINELRSLLSCLNLMKKSNFSGNI